MNIHLQATATKQQPTLRAPQGLPATAKYLIAMIDIDVNQNGTGTTVLHWLQPDMTLNAQTQLLSVNAANTTAANTAAAYLSPGPPPGPPHRYVQVLFEQPPNFAVPACFRAATQQNGRLGFDINQFVTVSGLQAPVAGNFVRVANTQAGPAATPLPTASALKSAVGCAATGGVRSAKMVKRLEEVLWSA